ncbi:hypothetical protein N7457_009595 [Penicillium paradoxum]|uniref:uncharacterized protein n=1 Tax=Penicillium paradoxum TaxID=176176 RepID=UPI00254661C7|nr:uncharacterized protein N7457_009595 [Penicillium paradoxum]KAJ5774699.1 hypothetical protein N7457_009595 [Penicillium paradoxum]
MDLLGYSYGDAFRSSALGKVLNLLLVLLILISYIPQYLRIHTFHGDGISPTFILLRSVYAASSLANILVLPSAWKIQQGCREKSPIGKCMIEMMDSWQFAADWIGSHIILILYLHYSSDRNLNLLPEQEQREDTPHNQQEQVQEEQPSGWRKRSIPFKPAIIVVIVLEVIMLVPSLFLAIKPRIQSTEYYILIHFWSFGTVGLSSILSLVYSLPQLWCTWTLGRMGSLSMLAMAIQIPTYFLMAASLAVQYGRLDEVPILGRWLAAWNPWINLIIKGCQEAIMLALCIYVYKKSATHETHPVLDEHTPLLLDGRDDDT